MKTTAQQSPAWIRLLPASLQSRLAGRTNLHAILANTGWLFADRILRMGAGLLVGVWVARYLGPEQFGLLNYATAFVALFGAIASLGLNGIVVRDLVKHPENANETLGTAFLLQFMGGLLAFALAVIAISFVRPDSDLAKWMVAVLGFVMVFKAADVVKYWFEAQVKSKYVVWVENGVFLLLAAIKVGLILVHAPLMAFVWTAFAEGALVAAGFIIVYARNCGRLRAWRIRYDRAIVLLKDSWPLILSGLAVMLYMRIDQIMIGQMLGDKEVGIYSAAVRISEVWYFVPVAIMSSVFPALVDAKNLDAELYYQRLQKVYDLVVWLSLAIAVPMTFMSENVVILLYGAEYSSAGTVLAIHIWTGLFVALGVVSSKWLLLENMANMILYRTGLGAVVNVVLNTMLIPAYGVQGAAMSTLISYSVVALWFDAIDARTRISFAMKLNSMFFRLIDGRSRMDS